MAGDAVGEAVGDKPAKRSRSEVNRENGARTQFGQPRPAPPPTDVVPGAAALPDGVLMRWVWENPEKARKRTPEWSWEQLRAADPGKFYERMVAAEKAAGGGPATAGITPSPGASSSPPVAGAIEDGPTTEVLALIERTLNEVRGRAGLEGLPPSGASS